MAKKKTLTAKELDEKFDAGDDISEYVDWDQATRLVSLRIPEWMLKQLDSESKRIGNTRQGLINAWLAERLDSLGKRAKESA